MREFEVCLDECHNDSTTVSLFGDYRDADTEPRVAGRAAPAIRWGHSKDHRPDLKQLLYILTVSDGSVPVYFQAVSGNVVDDLAYHATWRLLAELVPRPDFVYVADCKLATTENLNVSGQLGHQERARKWYDSAIALEKVWPDELRRYRDEAAELLGVTNPPEDVPDTELPANR